MTRLDTAKLHHWLTDAIDRAHDDRDSYGTTHQVVANQAARNADDELTAYRDIDGWLRSTATAQLHQPGHDLNPTALLNTGQVEADLDQLRTWILERAAATPIETRAKTYAAVAAELDRFAVQPGPFPHGDDTPGWAPPGPRWWPHRLQLAVAWARDLIR